MMLDYNELYRFNTKLITSLKNKSLKLSRSDFIRMKNASPESYELANNCFKVKNLNIYKKNLKVAAEKDMDYLEKYYLSTGNEHKISDAKHELGVFDSKVLAPSEHRSKFILDKLAYKFKKAVAISANTVVGISTSVSMYAYSSYITKRNFSSPTVDTLNEAFFEQILTESLDVTEDDSLGYDVINEDFGLSTGMLAMIGLVYLKAAIAYSFGVENKRKREILQTAFPGGTSMFMLPALLGMVASAL